MRDIPPLSIVKPAATEARAGRGGPAKAAPGRIPSLDGVRALAVGTVILIHLVQRFEPPHLTLPFVDGVQIFFVLSGFLITLLLLREQEQSGKIELLSFYKRRALRILPPFYVYLGFAVAVCGATSQVVPWQALVSGALFLSNVDPGAGSPFTNHIWSLAVEEQFYLVWPVLLIALLRWGGRRAAAWAALGLILLSPVFRMAFTVLPMGALVHHQSVLLPGRMDSLFAGCLFALLLEDGRFEHWYSAVERLWWTAPVFVGAVSPVLRLLLGNAYTLTVGYTLESFAGAYFILWVSRNPGSGLGRVLNWRPTVWVGLASYSLYLYQMPLIEFDSGIAWLHTPVRILAAVALAGFVSYVVVERPVARVRARLALAARRAGLREEGVRRSALESKEAKAAHVA